MGRFRRKPLTPEVADFSKQFNFTQDVLESLASGDGTRPAFLAVDPVGVIERRTLRELADDAARWSALLRVYGLAPGDRVLVHLGYGVAWPAVVLGAVKAGLTVVSCPDTATADDLELAAEHAAARLVVTDRTHTSTTLAMDTVVADDVLLELRTTSRSQPTHATSVSDLAMLVYDGETATAVTHGHTSSLRHEAEDHLEVRPGDIVWCTAPAGSSASIRRFLGVLACSATTALHDGPLPPEQQVELVERLGVNVLSATPEELRGIMECAPERHSLGRLRLVVSEGGALDPDVATVFRRTYRLAVREAGDETGALADTEAARRIAAAQAQEDERRRKAEPKATANAERRAKEAEREAAREAERQRKAEEGEARRLVAAQAKEEERRRKAEEKAAAEAARAAEQQRRTEEAERRKAEEAAAEAARAAEQQRRAEEAERRKAEEKAATDAERAAKRQRRAEETARRKAEEQERKEAARRARKAEAAPPPPGSTKGAENGAAPDEPEPQLDSLIVQRLQAYGQYSAPPKPKPPAE